MTLLKQSIAEKEETIQAIGAGLNGNANAAVNNVEVIKSLQNEIFVLKEQNERLLKEVEHVRQDFSQSRKKWESEILEREDAIRLELENIAKQDDFKRLELLSESIKIASYQFERKLERVEAMGMAIIGEAFEGVLKLENYHELILSFLEKQIGFLKRESIVKILVSSKDFPSSGELEVVATALNAGNIDVVSEAMLPQGACEIQLRLGKVELSLPKYRDKVIEIFESLGD